MYLSLIKNTLKGTLRFFKVISIPLGFCVCFYSYLAYSNIHKAQYTFEVIKKWQTQKGSLFKGSSTIYYVQVKATVTKSAGFMIYESSPNPIQIVKVSYPYYQQLQIGSKVTGDCNRFKYYDPY